MFVANLIDFKGFIIFSFTSGYALDFGSII